MFNFLKNIMNNEKSKLTNDVYSLHRVLKTDIKKDPNEKEDEIIFFLIVISAICTSQLFIKYEPHTEWAVWLHPILISMTMVSAIVFTDYQYRL